jgi:hypothetical protein
VKAPRFRIAWVMVAIAIAALDFGAIRSWLEFNSLAADSLLLGALPMANVLMVGILVGRWRPGSRPFVLGFETFGAMALAVYAALSVYHDAAAVTAYLELYKGSWETIINDLPPFAFTLVRICLFVVILIWPQMAFALIGGVSLVGSKSPSPDADRPHQGLFQFSVPLLLMGRVRTTFSISRCQ